MKNILFVSLMTVLFISCDKDDPQSNEPAKDCDCNRAMEHTKFYVVGDAQANPPTQGFYFGTYVLINDCTGVQYNGEWNSANGDPEPVNGECYSN